MWNDLAYCYCTFECNLVSRDRSEVPRPVDATGDPPERDRPVGIDKVNWRARSAGPSWLIPPVFPAYPEPRHHTEKLADEFFNSIDRFCNMRGSS
jgi:hypothetical protein